ncbi:hypothetical protein ACWGR4_42310 [Embleya sp. NPDC055664]
MNAWNAEAISPGRPPLRGCRYPAGHRRFAADTRSGRPNCRWTQPTRVHFARYHLRRTERALVVITRDDKMRTVLFDGTDAQLTNTILELARVADVEGRPYFGCEGIDDPRLTERLTG